jgi:hypothetical protein
LGESWTTSNILFFMHIFRILVGNCRF